MPWHSSRNISKQQNLPHKTKGDTKMTKNFEKTIKAQKKTKLSTLWPSGYPLVPHSLWGLVVFFVFSKFFLFLTKRQKPRENKKHTKAPKLSTQWPYGYPLAPHSLWSFFLFFSSFFCFWPKVANTSRKRNKTNGYPLARHSPRSFPPVFPRFFPTCQVRVVRFYVSCLLFLLLLLLLPFFFLLLLLRLLRSLCPTAMMCVLQWCVCSIACRTSTAIM